MGQKGFREIEQISRGRKTLKKHLCRLQNARIDNTQHMMQRDENSKKIISEGNGRNNKRSRNEGCLPQVYQ